MNPRFVEACDWVVTLRSVTRAAEKAQFEMLTFQRGSQPHVALLDQFRRARIEQPRVHAISSISAMVELVVGSLGIATLPRATVEPLSERLPLTITHAPGSMLATDRLNHQLAAF